MAITKLLNKYFPASKILFELFLVLTPIILFIDFAVFSPITSKNNISSALLQLFIALNIVYLYILLNTLTNINKRFFKILTQPVYIPIIIFIILRQFFLDATPRWNSAVYFQELISSISRFDFSLSSFLGFNWYGHPSMGFGLISSIFQLLQPANIFMLNVGNLTIGIIAIISFYTIAKHIFYKSKTIEIVLTTTIFAINPLFFTATTSFVPDLGVLSFFLASIAALVNGKYILSSFMFTLLVFSKETGALAFALFASFYFIFFLIKGLLKRTSRSIFELGTLVIPSLAFILYLVHTKGQVWVASGKNPLTVANNCTFCFSFAIKNISDIFSEVFILNFSWIFSLTITIAIINHLLFRHRRPTSNVITNGKLLTTLILTFICYVVFFMSYVNYIIPNYISLTTFFLIIIFYRALLILVTQNHVRHILLIIIIIISVIQNTRNIDFVSSKILGTFNLGNYQMIKVGSEYTCDGMVYNTQYINISRLINKFNHNFNITGKDNIIMGSYNWTNYYSGWSIYPPYFDQTTKKISFNTENSFKPNIYTLLDTDKYPPIVYYLAFPWLEDEEASLSKIGTLYNINKKTTVEINGYWINAYNLIKK